MKAWEFEDHGHFFTLAQSHLFIKIKTCFLLSLLDNFE